MPHKIDFKFRLAAAACLSLSLLSALAWLAPAAAPTTASAQTGGSLFVRKVSLKANDVIYSPSTNMLYASVPSAVGAGGNSIVPVDPSTGTVGASVFVGSEPGRLAVSDDGNTMYVSLDGAASLRRFDLQTQTPGLEFSIGNDSFFGPYSVNDLAVAPGAPGTVAIARLHPGISPPEAGVAIFDNGVQRPKTGVGHIAGSDYVAYSASASKLYGGGFYDGLRTMTIDATGVVSTTYATESVGARIKVAGGLVYGSAGKVINPDTGSLLGTFSGAASMAFVPDAAVGRVYYLNIASGGLTLTAFDVNTFLPVGSQTVSGFSGSPTTLLRWGANGLVFTTSVGEVGIIQTSLIPSGSSVPTPTPTPSATPTPTPVYVPTFVRKVNLPTADVVYNAATQSLYASVPSAAGSSGNSITPINPSTGEIGTSVFVGSEPRQLALADDGRTLYAYLEGAKAARRFDMQTQTPGLQFSVGSQTPADMEVMPGSPQSLAVSPGVNFSTGPTIYDNGVARPKFGSGSFYAVLPIEFGASPSVLYGYDSYSSGFEVVTFDVDASGVTTKSVTGNLLSGYSTDIKFANGLLYSSSGRVADPEAKRVVGTFSGTYGAFVVDVALGRIFYISSGDFGSSLVLKAYDLNTYLPLGSVQLPNVTGTPTRVVRWGVNGLAFRTSGTGFGDTSSGSVYIIQSALVSAALPVPTDVGLTTDKLDAYEFLNSVTVNVTRTGDLSGPTTVSYATADGTATAGSDYTSASGTLTFAAGETAKSFNVTIRQDNLYEGAETFKVTLGSPTDGAILLEPASATVTINDDEAPPFINIGDVRVVEGNAGTTEAQFLVSLSNPSVQTVSVNYATADGTASSASDFNGASGTLTLPALTTSALVKVSVNGDLQIEPDETFTVSLSGPVNSSLSRAQATGTIANDDAPGRFQFSAQSYSLSEDGGSAVITVNRASGLSGTVSVNYATSDGTAAAGTDYTATSGTLTFSEGESAKTFSVPVINDTRDEPSETVLLTLSGPTGGASLGSPTVATLNLTNDDRPLFQFGSTFYATGEADGQVLLTVKRTGDPSAPVSVDYTTADGTASELSDYNLTLGTLRFAAGETEKTLAVLVTDDALVEPDETFLLNLAAPSGGSLGTPATATVTLHSDDAAPGPNPVGDGFNAQFFVRQHYHDFLNREPDAPGLQFWTDEITKCGPDAGCSEVKRVNVSAAFFLSIEFQETGFFIYRLHQAAYNTQETLRWRTFLADTQEIGRGVQVGVGDWRARLESNKRELVDRFVTSPAFVSTYQALPNAQYVEALAANTLDPLAPGLGGALTQAERDQLVADLNQSKKTRAEVLRAVAENAEFSRRQTNKAFVLMQYYGYLRRNPNSGPDSDFVGYNFWLSKLNEFNGNFIRAEMVKAFIQSIEYRKRFGQ